MVSTLTTPSNKWCQHLQPSTSIQPVTSEIAPESKTRGKWYCLLCFGSTDCGKSFILSRYTLTSDHSAALWFKDRTMKNQNRSYNPESRSYIWSHFETSQFQSWQFKMCRIEVCPFAGLFEMQKLATKGSIKLQLLHKVNETAKLRV